jgi:hypothetical protein
MYHHVNTALFHDQLSKLVLGQRDDVVMRFMSGDLALDRSTELKRLILGRGNGGYKTEQEGRGKECP